MRHVIYPPRAAEQRGDPLPDRKRADLAIDPSDLPLRHIKQLYLKPRQWVYTWLRAVAAGKSPTEPREQLRKPLASTQKPLLDLFWTSFDGRHGLMAITLCAEASELCPRDYELGTYGLARLCIYQRDRRLDRMDEIHVEMGVTRPYSHEKRSF